ncbi:hypothetical protein ASZ90_009776 [hydrocarbon metagenome]|uniref:Uncharacterized protein n=1 Tax=hydrocarbon metagenome TaxID=938273 RepID=A0A0W8FI81_9ZZZZ
MSGISTFQSRPVPVAVMIRLQIAWTAIIATPLKRSRNERIYRGRESYRAGRFDRDRGCIDIHTGRTDNRGGDV